jgi:hypothetical protein
VFQAMADASFSPLDPLRDNRNRSSRDRAQLPSASNLMNRAAGYLAVVDFRHVGAPDSQVDEIESEFANAVKRTSRLLWSLYHRGHCHRPA